jgi:hypothetical protein
MGGSEWGIKTLQKLDGPAAKRFIGRRSRRSKEQVSRSSPCREKGPTEVIATLLGWMGPSQGIFQSVPSSPAHRRTDDRALDRRFRIAYAMAAPKAASNRWRLCRYALSICASSQEVARPIAALFCFGAASFLNPRATEISCPALRASFEYSTIFCSSTRALGP